MKTIKLAVFALIGAAWIGLLTTVVRSGISSGPNDSKKWSDRVIRTMGGLLIGMLALMGLIFAIVHYK